tara:strand:- start:960 stop:1223 length:264 start_codon:yes stop_codon:yes gene_type:complete
MEEQIKTIVKKVLEKNSWGIYFKGKPLIEMPVNGEASIYKLNDIHVSELEGAISDELKLIFEELNKQGDTECHTQQRQKIDRSSEEM